MSGRIFNERKHYGKSRFRRDLRLVVWIANLIHEFPVHQITSLIVLIAVRLTIYTLCGQRSRGSGILDSIILPYAENIPYVNENSNNRNIYVIDMAQSPAEIAFKQGSHSRNHQRSHHRSAKDGGTTSRNQERS
jgi:hypothetical protein